MFHSKDESEQLNMEAVPHSMETNKECFTTVRQVKSETCEVHSETPEQSFIAKMQVNN